MEYFVSIHVQFLGFGAPTDAFVVDTTGLPGTSRTRGLAGFSGIAAG